MMFYDISMVNLDDAQMLEKLRVKELVEYERYCRDYSDYGTLQAERRLWYGDARIKTTWFDGPPNEFMPEVHDPVPKIKVPDEGVIEAVHHRVNNTVVWLHGSRAIAELLCTITFRVKVANEWMDIGVMSRMHYRAEKRDGKWGLVFMDVIYEQDRMDPVFQDCTLTIPRTALQRHRNINWNQAVRSDISGKSNGRDENLLYGYDRPNEVLELYLESSRWLGVEEENA